MRHATLVIVILVAGSCARAPQSGTPEHVVGRAVVDTLRLHPINPLSIPGPDPNRITSDATITMTLHGAVSEAVAIDPLWKEIYGGPCCTYYMNRRSLTSA